MANVPDSLAKILKIQGCVGTALVDVESGMTLGTAGGGSEINLEVAAAGNTEVIRAKMRVAEALGLEGHIDDILITLTTQYHIIMPTPTKAGLFFYVVIDRSKGNLAMARMQISEIGKALSI